MKFDSIFDSLGPVGGILTGDKVKPVLLNSKLPVDILGRVRSPNRTLLQKGIKNSHACKVTKLKAEILCL